MTIDFDSLNVFQKFPSNIPWFNIDKGLYAVIIQPAVTRNQKAKKSPEEDLKDTAVDAFIEFYLPEFYPFIYNKGKRSGGFGSTYKKIRKDILGNLDFIKSDQGPADIASSAPTAPKYLYNTAPGAVNFKKIREALRTYNPPSAQAPAVVEALEASESGEICLVPGQTRPLPTYSSGFPDFDDAQEFFLEQQSAGTALSVGGTVIIKLGITIGTMNELGDALKAYHEQLTRYPVPLKIPLDLEAIRTEVRDIVSDLVANVRRDMNLSGRDVPSLTNEDVLRIVVDAKQKIKSATYEIDMGKTTITEPLKIGMFSLIKYKASIQDRWVMMTLINHQRIIKGAQNNGASGPGLPSIMNFIKDTYGKLLATPTWETVRENSPVDVEAEDGSVELSFQAPPPPGVDPLLFNTIFQAAESSIKLDVSNPLSLATTISTFVSGEEMAALELALDDPSTMAALLTENASKKFESKFPIKKLMDDIKAMIKEAKGISVAAEERKTLEQAVTDTEAKLRNAENAPDVGEQAGQLRILDAESAYNDAVAALSRDKTSSREGGATKQVRDTLAILDGILLRLGIENLIAEAMICLTMGSNFTLDRLRQAIDQALDLAQFIEDYEKPKIPRPFMVVPDFPDIKIAFNILGDPPLWQQIRDMILQILAETLLDLVSGLADMIKFNCDNLLNRPEEMGAIDAAAAMRDNPKGGKPLKDPEMQDRLDNAFKRFGLNQEKGFDYLSGVSQILTPLELCRLYNSPADVQDTTIQKIAIFNKGWPEEQIPPLQSRNQILSFFASMAALADITSICNDLVNDVDVREGIQNYCLNEADLSTLADQESIQKLADLLNNGLPMEAPLPDFLCPDNPMFISNPIVDRVIPQMFNITVENAKMQFAYSVEACRTTLLEPQVTAGNANPALNKALQDTCARGKIGDDCVEPPVMDPTFISIIADIFDQILNSGLEIDPAVCPDLNLAKLGGSLDDFRALMPILNSILEDALDENARAEMAKAQKAVNRVKDTIEQSGGTPPNVTYVFPTDFYNNFMAIAHQSPPEYLDIQGGDKPDNAWRTITKSPGVTGKFILEATGRFEYGSAGSERTYYSKMLQDKTTDEYGRLRLQYNFLKEVIPHINPIRIEYYSNDDIQSGRRPVFRLGIPSGLLPGVENGWLHIAVPDDSFTPLYGTSTPGMLMAPPDTALGHYGTESGFNPYIFNFTYPLQKQLVALSNNSLSAGDKRYLQDKLQKQVFPTVLNGVMKRSFDYIQRNGMFTMTKLNKLNLFKDNSNCEPSQVGDLLDVRGILDQAKKNFRQGSCNDGGTAQELSGDALKLALINLEIQVYIVEFLIKNIFVFSAFQFEEIFNKPIIRELFLTSMISELETRFTSDRGAIKEFLYGHFEKLISREQAKKAGGIAHSFTPNTVVPYLDAGTNIRKVKFKQLIEFLIEERMGYTYEVCGQMVNTMQSINNILKTTGTGELFEDVFIKDILGIYKAPYGRKNAPMKSGEGRIFFAKYAHWSGITNWSDLATSEILIPWDPRELQKLQKGWDQQAAAFRKAFIENDMPPAWDLIGRHIYQPPPVADTTADFIAQNTARPTGGTRHTLQLQSILGSPAGGAMPVRTSTAVDFIDMIELTDGVLPIFEGFKLGYKLMFNFPQYSGAAYRDVQWDQAGSPFLESFRPGPVRDLMTLAVQHQPRAVGKDSILDSAQVDLDSATEGAQILGDLLTVDIYDYGDFNPNELPDIGAQNTSPPQTSNTPSMGFSSAPPTPPGPPFGPGAPSTAANTYDKVKRFNRTEPSNHIPKIKNDLEYSRFINQTFNPEMVMMLPVLYNLGLTNSFFPGIERNFETTKLGILDLFGVVSRTSRKPELVEDGNMVKLNNELGSAGGAGLEFNGREFILKMLRETPIKILKGLVELIDPHVAISKIIRDITGMVFNYVIMMIDVGIDLAESTQPDQSPIKPMLSALDGEQVLALAFCGLNTMNAEATAALPDPPGPLEAPSLGPKMTVKGVDFTGTIAGLFMMPPTPLGIIYLLLMLLDAASNEEAEAEGTGNSQQNAADGQSSNVC